MRRAPFLGSSPALLLTVSPLAVFVYRFTDPNDRQTYDVMWDYLGGFVRISPFFKSRKHKKVPSSLRALVCHLIMIGMLTRQRRDRPRCSRPTRG